MTLLESIKKKQTFLKHMVDLFSLNHCQAVWGRAEERARREHHREKYDLVFCRALGRFTTGLELAMPFIRMGGAWAAHRGADGPEEAQAAQDTVKQMGGEIGNILPYQLPGLSKQRYIIRIDKKRPTPETYPRRPGIPAKRPL